MEALKQLGAIKQFLDVVEQETGCTVTLETRIKEVVKDSLEFVSLIGAVEDKFDLKVGSEKLAKLTTIGDLYAIVSA